MYVRVPSRQHHYFQVGIVQYLLAGFSFSVNKNEMITLNRQTGLEKKKRSSIFQVTARLNFLSLIQNIKKNTSKHCGSQNFFSENTLKVTRKQELENIFRVYNLMIRFIFGWILNQILILKYDGSLFFACIEKL